MLKFAFPKGSGRRAERLPGSERAFVFAFSGLVSLPPRPVWAGLGLLCRASHPPLSQVLTGCSPSCESGPDGLLILCPGCSSVSDLAAGVGLGFSL